MAVLARNAIPKRDWARFQPVDDWRCYLGHRGSGGKRLARGSSGLTPWLCNGWAARLLAPYRASGLARLQISWQTRKTKKHGLDRGARFYRLDASTFPHSNHHLHPVVRFLMSDTSTIRSSKASSMSVEVMRAPIDTAKGERTT